MLKESVQSKNSFNNYIYFSFAGETFNPQEVTKELKIKPTTVILKKNLTPKHTSWEYRINVKNNTNFEEPLNKLIEIFNPKKTQINKLKKELGLSTLIQFVVDIDINSNLPTPYFGLNKKAIDFLYKTETEVDYDVYKSDNFIG